MNELERRVCDAIDAGIPCVMCGPGRVELAHAVDEHVQIEQLVAAAQIAALFVLRSL